MTAVMHGSASVSIGMLLLMAVWFALVSAMAADLHHLEVLLGSAVRDALRAAKLTEEQAADLMGMDLSNFRKALRGEGRLQIGIARLMRLGVVFMASFAPTLLYHAARLHAEQVREDALEAAKALIGRKVS